MPDATPAEALTFFVRRYDDLAFEVELLEQRVAAGTLGPGRGGRLRQAGPRHPQGRPGRRRPGRARRPARRADHDDLAPSASSAARSGPRSSRWPRPTRSGSPTRPRSSPWAPTGATAPTGCGSCSTSGRRCPGWRSRSTTPCGVGSRPPGRRTPGAGSRTSPTSTRSATRPACVKEKLVVEAEALVVLDRVGPDRRQVPRPDAPVEGRRPRARRASTTSCGPGSAAPRTPSSAAGTRPTPSWTPSSPPTPRRRRPCSSRPRRSSRSPTSRPPRRRSATSPTAGTRPARCRATGSRTSRAGSARSSRRSAASRTTSGSAATPRSRPAPTTWSPSWRRPAPTSRPTWPRPGRQGDAKKIAEIEENLASRRSFLEMARRASADFG